MAKLVGLDDIVGLIVGDDCGCFDGYKVGWPNYIECITKLNIVKGAI